jgi:hypothetical protein
MFRRRTETGRPASSMRLRTATPTVASACWPEKLRARRQGPMMALYRPIAVSTRERMRFRTFSLVSNGRIASHPTCRGSPSRACSRHGSTAPCCPSCSPFQTRRAEGGSSKLHSPRPASGRSQPTRKATGPYSESTPNSAQSLTPLISQSDTTAYTTLDFVRTMEEVLGLQPMNPTRRHGETNRPSVPLKTITNKQSID